MIEPFWKDSKQREIGAFSYIPNIKDYIFYREGGSLQGENVVMIGQDALENGAFLNQYMCLPADGKNGFEIRDETDILLSFRDDLKKSKTLQREECIWRGCDVSSFDEQKDYGLSIEFIDTVKGLSEHQKNYYSENSYNDHRYFDVDKINLILKTPVEEISLEILS